MQPNYPPLFLGLDVSTAVAGYCVLNSEAQILRLGYWKLNLYETLLDRIEFLLGELGKLQEDLGHSVKTIGIENFLKAYSGGKTSKQTLISLAQMNILTQYIITKNFPQCELKIISVISARKKVVPMMPHKIDKTQFKNQKEWIFDYFMKNIGWDFPLKPKAKTPIDEAKDMVDSWIICCSLLS